MILQAIGRALGLLLLVVLLVAFEFFILHRSEEADFRFEIRMGKDINRIGRQLREAGLEEKTAQTIKYALNDVQRNVQSYVDDKFFCQFTFLSILAPIVVAGCVASTCQRTIQKT